MKRRDLFALAGGATATLLVAPAVTADDDGDENDDPTDDPPEDGDTVEIGVVLS